MTDNTPTRGRIYCPHLRLESTNNGWHWHRGEKVQCPGGRAFQLDDEMIERGQEAVDRHMLIAGFDLQTRGAAMLAFRNGLRAALEMFDDKFSGNIGDLSEGWR